jgi:hypothetical protein
MKYRKIKEITLSPQGKADGATMGIDPIGISEGSKNERGEAVHGRIAEPFFLNSDIKYATCPNCGCLCATYEIRFWCSDCSKFFYPEPKINFPEHSLESMPITPNPID